MALLNQAASTVADFDKFVLAMLYRIPSSTLVAGTGRLLEFGQTTEGPCGITVLTDGGIDARLYGLHEGMVMVAGGVDQPPNTASAIVTATSGAVSPGTWQRLILSCDFSSGASYTYNGPGDWTIETHGYRMWLSNNDTDYSPTVITDPGGTNHTGRPAGSIDTAGALPNGPADLTTPAFSIAMNGFEFSIPSLAANVASDYNGVFQMADFLFWTGVTLDTSIQLNRRLFISSTGKPVRPSVAIAALGTPKYRIGGPASNVSTNGGIAGNLLRTGSITDFNPGP